MSLEGRNIIFDTDMGPDDAWALILLIKAAAYFKFNIIAVTCTYGNSKLENVARNTINVLNTMDRLDIPVYLGANGSIVYGHVDESDYFGVDGFGNTLSDITELPMDLIQNEGAISAMYRLAKQHKNVTVFCVGPLTNLALTIRSYPDFADHIENVFIMGGNINDPNYELMENGVEFNFAQDPEADFIVLNFMPKPITIVPWETINTPKWNVTSHWRFNELGKNPNKILRLLNAAEQLHANATNWIVADPLTVGAFLNPHSIIVKSIQRQCSIVLSGKYRGLMLTRKSKSSNITIVTKIKQNQMKKIFLWIADKLDFHMAFKVDNQMDSSKWITIKYKIPKEMYKQFMKTSKKKHIH